MLQWKPRLGALTALLVLVAFAAALGYVNFALDLFW